MKRGLFQGMACLFLALAVARGGLLPDMTNGTPGEFAAGNALNWFTGANSASAMFGVSNGYLKRNTDYRSVLGEIIRKHLGASQTQLNQIIPGYADASQRLLAGGTVADSGTVSTAIRGEVGFL